jgi:hypothetical protein
METLKKSDRPAAEPMWGQRGKAFANLLKMGHCAPAVMRTLLDISTPEKDWPVKLNAGMPGGIGNSGYECGGVTSPLVMLGIEYGLRQVERGLPIIFDKGHALIQNFLGCQHTLQCREIRGKDRFPRHCIAPVTRSPELYLACRDGNHTEAIPEERREGYARLYYHMGENEFQCAQVVLVRLGYKPAENQELFDAVAAFSGGTIFMGGTCSAFSAGVMAIGLSRGEIENSYPRVLRMLAIMTAGGNAFDEKLNKFNKSMNRGYRLSKWFGREFGSTQCQAITECTFSEAAGVSNYIEGERINRCRAITDKVAEKVQKMLA